MSALQPVISVYFNRREKMSIKDGLIVRGERVKIQKVARSQLLRRIYNLHLGVYSCLIIACNCLFWPSMTGDVKNLLLTCEACRKCE